jgi:hypothetical protein
MWQKRVTKVIEVAGSQSGFPKVDESAHHGLFSLGGFVDRGFVKHRLTGKTCEAVFVSFVWVN